MSSPETNLFLTSPFLNLGHRGASAAAPENTLPAFKLATEQGAHGVELDAQLSADGHVVIMHDFDVDKTTDGRGPVKTKLLADLKELDAGSHFSPKFAGTPIPTLDEVFAALGPVLLFNIELKTADIRDKGLEAEVIRLIEDHNQQDRVMLSSFNPFALMRARRHNSRIKRGLLWDPTLPPLLRMQIFRRLARPHMFHPYWKAVTPKMVNKEHRRGARVNVWTCNDPAAMKSLMAIGVSSIMTDYPDRLKQVLDESTTA